MVKQYNNPAQIKATERVSKLISFILSNGEDNEDWKEIEWADSDYYVSSNGRVLSLCNREPRILKSFMCNGYLCVSICGHDRRINRLVATAFIDNPDNKPIAHHKNHDKTKNTRDNLAWATHSENTIAYYDSKKQEESEAPAG